LDNQDGRLIDASALPRAAASDRLQQDAAALLEHVAAVVLGKRDVARLCVVALLAGEHVLLEDVPGVGKTLMARSIARSIKADFCRIQFKPDLLPSDVLGGSVFNVQQAEFVFNRGPIFSNFVLADEINRAPSRTQSALLESMGDGQVSCDGQTLQLPRPFMVIATQNPYEFEGTYALPESQLDRFLLRTSMGYPAREFEAKILESHRDGEPVDRLQPLLDLQRIQEIQRAVRDVVVDPTISQYMLDIVHQTRSSPDLAVGVSTRGTLAWYRAVQALAFLDGRDYAIPDDARELAVPVIGHRVSLQSVAPGSNREDTEEIVRAIVEGVPAPT
jgi:MoxR-like ATPase